jgi:glycosyltransferase involved in cell wall biosynthesis
MTNGRQVAKAFWGRETVNSSHFHFYAPVDSGKFAPDSCRREATRRRLGFGPDHVVIGTVGNRVWQKNHAFLVKAASRLKDLYPKLRFLIIGEPSGSYLKEYSRSVETPAIELNREYPNFVQFASPGCEVNDWLQALDVFVLVSHAEGVPIALFEAMSAAKAVVSARVGSIEEIVEENVTGFLYERDDLQVFLSRITELSLDQARRERMGEAGRNVILEKFSLNQVVTAHVRAYGTAIKNYERSK